MSRLSDIVYTALDQADDAWQHGIAHDPEQYIQDMTDAVVRAIDAHAAPGREHIHQFTLRYTCDCGAVDAGRTFTEPEQ